VDRLRADRYDGPAPGATAADRLPEATSVLAVCAHPDDESFGLGAVLSAFAEQGARTSVLCLTHGEASTLGAEAGDLHRIRQEEFGSAAEALGVDAAHLLGFGDGRVADEPVAALAAEVSHAVARAGADLLLVFDEGGITGHPDHVTATEVARSVAARTDLPVLAWTLPTEVAEQLAAEFPAGFTGRAPDAVHLSIEVDRTRQLAAIRCHATQSGGNPVLWRRLALQGDREVLRYLEPVDTEPPR